MSSIQLGVVTQEALAFLARIFLSLAMVLVFLSVQTLFSSSEVHALESSEEQGQEKISGQNDEPPEGALKKIFYNEKTKRKLRLKERCLNNSESACLTLIRQECTEGYESYCTKIGEQYLSKSEPSSEDLKRAYASLEPACNRHRFMNACYGLATFYGITDNEDESVKYLRKAIELGFDNHEKIISDVGFDSVRSYDEFQKVLIRLKAGNVKKIKKQKGTVADR